MAVDSTDRVIFSESCSKIDSLTSEPSSKDTAVPSLATAAQIKPKPELSEIRNIAYHVTPPTVPNTRTTPITNDLKRTDPFQFGSRFLEDTDDVFAWNAWDHVDPSQDPLYVSYSSSQYAFQREHAASDFDRRRFNADPKKWWNKFYGNNTANFFKDRKWLRQEFPVLGAATGITDEEIRVRLAGPDVAESAAAAAHNDVQVRSQEKVVDGPWNVILEIGAGAGNTAFPLLKDNRNPELMIHACDFSSTSVKLIKGSKLYNPEHLNAFQWDMSTEYLPPEVRPGTVDIVMLIFAFSALAPSQWSKAIQNIWDVLRPGGEVCFRDYGRGDLAQVRFKKGRWLGENFYVRGDGTRVYFFEQEELKRIWSGEVVKMADQAQHPLDDDGGEHTENSDNRGNHEHSPEFEIIHLGTDRRLLVNRQKQLKMYRCWQQGRFRKPETATASV